MVIHTILPDFILFLYIHLAQIDESYDPRELAIIKEKMKGLFPKGTDIERKLYQAIREYHKLDKAMINEMCADTITFFSQNGHDLSVKLIKDLKEIINADGKIEQSEQQALNRLTVLLDQAHMKPA